MLEDVGAIHGTPDHKGVRIVAISHDAGISYGLGQ